MKTVITNPISNIPQNPKSHTFGWTQVWQDQLNSTINHRCTRDILDADTIYIDHGANFGGTLNLFGGANKEVYDRVNLIASCENVISLDWDMPDYGAMLKKRIGAATTYEKITDEWCNALSKRLSIVKSLKQQDLKDMDGITVGDSHTIAFSDKRDKVYRNDGKTLYGQLKRGLKELFRDTPIDVPRITFCLGSIDIRHHLLRHECDIKDLIKTYVKQGNECGDDVWYAAPVPVEFEGRRIPKSGFFKGTAFFGTWQQRVDLTNTFISILEEESNGKIIKPPAEWYKMDSKLYANTFMEFGSSFHIAPLYQRRNNWGETFLGT